MFKLVLLGTPKVEVITNQTFKRQLTWKRAENFTHVYAIANNLIKIHTCFLRSPFHHTQACSNIPHQLSHLKILSNFAWNKLTLEKQFPEWRDDSPQTNFNWTKDAVTRDMSTNCTHTYNNYTNNILNVDTLSVKMLLREDTRTFIYTYVSDYVWLITRYSLFES